MSAVLAAAAVLCAFAAAWELAGEAEGRASLLARRLVWRIGGARAGSLAQAAARMRLPERLRRAGLADRVEPAAVIAAKLAGAGVGGAVALVAAPAVPARLGVAVAGLLVAAGFLAPDALLERAARRRRDRFVAALPDALDLLALSAASGRSPATAFAEIAGGTSGPLAHELGVCVAEIECGRPAREAIEALRERIAGAEVGALAAALERSRAYGSPLAEQLQAQASSLRREARRRLGDRASRAAPKIQLVVALVLVPSVLVAIIAAIVAHSDALFASV